MQRPAVVGRVPSLTRRNVIRAGVASLAGLAGCSALSGTETHDPPRLSEVYVHNRHVGHEHTVAVQLWRGGAIQLWRDVTVRPPETEAGNPGNLLRVYGDTIAPPETDVGGPWTLRARLQATDEHESFIYSWSETTAECVYVPVQVTPDGSLALGVGYGGPCDRTTADA